MTDRYLTITMQSDWKGALRAMAKAADADTYQGEVLNFESPGRFFGQLTESVGRLFEPRRARASCQCVSWPVQSGAMSSACTKTW